MYDNARLNAISDVSFDFEALKSKLEILWGDKKSKKGTAHIATAKSENSKVGSVKSSSGDATQSLRCPTHRGFFLPCWACNPCKPCQELNFSFNHKQGDQFKCFSERQKSSGVAKMASKVSMVSAPVDSGASAPMFRNKAVFQFY